ncbi:MAG: hypothetical protein EZS28_032336 [Streblomastix strix]|uniref:Uncharacterized protein n=1 Tax=Streblomastix strix TaxID=222440 RepID=A0A5J4UN62_9EUKA|nr:MAG: hypothetical protein EZS28_032336 [Streblomastix strix]
MINLASLLQIHNYLITFFILLKQVTRDRNMLELHRWVDCTDWVGWERGGARVYVGDVLKQSPNGDYYSTSPTQTLAPPLYF